MSLNYNLVVCLKQKAFVFRATTMKLNSWLKFFELLETNLMFYNSSLFGIFLLAVLAQLSPRFPWNHQQYRFYFHPFVSFDVTFYLFAVARTNISACFVDLTLDISVPNVCKQIYFVMLQHKSFYLISIV